jgi:hypothetical protein
MIKIADGRYALKINSLFDSPHGVSTAVIIRIMRESNGWRVDRSSGLGLWEAIDNGAPCRTLKAAKALVKVYVQAAQTQKTYQPCIG